MKQQQSKTEPQQKKKRKKKELEKALVVGLGCGCGAQAQDLHGWSKHWRAEFQAQNPSSFTGTQAGRGDAGHIPLQSLNPQKPLPFPADPLTMSGALCKCEPHFFPSCPSGTLVPSHLNFFCPFLTPPISYLVMQGFLPSPQVSKVPHWCLISALIVRRCKLHILLLHHLDPIPKTWILTKVIWLKSLCV